VQVNVTIDRTVEWWWGQMRVVAEIYFSGWDKCKTSLKWGWTLSLALRDIEQPDMAELDLDSHIVAHQWYEFNSLAAK
jgi:hypothetical protein